MDVNVLRDKLPSILTELEEINLVYLFGSQVNGNLGPLSDVDLAVLIDRGVEQPPIQARFSHELARALGTDLIDIVVLNRAPVELAYSIISQGTVLYERDVATRVEYEAYVLGRYGDYLPVLRAQFKDVLRGDKDGTRVRRYRAALRRTERTLREIAANERPEPN